MTQTETYQTSHAVDNEIDIQQALELFWKRFPLSRSLRVHDGFITYELRGMDNRKWEREANEIITDLDLQLKATLENNIHSQILTIERK
jgi:hypothetical protein